MKPKMIPKMMPGQTPYSKKELSKLYGLISEVEDLSEKDEIENFRWDEDLRQYVPRKNV